MLSIAIQATDQASSIFQKFGNNIQSSILGNLKNGLGNIVFGLKNLGTEGTIAGDAIKAGIGDVAGAAAMAGAVGLVAVGAAAVAVGIKATQMAGDYEQAMNKVKALTGTSTDQMAQYDAGVKQLATDAGVAPTALADGLYNVLSASYKGADAMKVLTLATEDSKIGMTNATVTTDALTNVLRTFGVQSGDITRVNGEMLKTVTLGKATFEQYASTIVKAASSSAQFHVSMETMNAAWSTMTSSGIRAAQASTDFQQSLKVMYGNIGTVTKSLEKNGIAFDEAKFNTLDYGGKVVMLNAALEQANAKHIKVTGVTLQAAQAIQTISQHIGDYKSNLAALSDKQAMANQTAESWATTQAGLNQSMDRLKATLDVLLINIGQQLLPIITPIVNQFTAWIASSNGVGGALSGLGNILQQIGGYLQGDDFQGFIADVQTVGNQIRNILTPAFQALAPYIPSLGQALTGVGFVFTGIIIPAIDTVAFGLGQFLEWIQRCPPAIYTLATALSIVGAILLGIATKAIIQLITALPGMIVQLAAMTAGWVADAVAATAAAIAELIALAPFILIGIAIVALIVIIILLATHWGQVTKFLQGAWQSFTTWFMGALHATGQFFADIWNGMVSWVVNAWNGIVSGTKAAWNWIVNAVKAGAQWVLDGITAPFRAIGALFVWLYNHNYYFQALVDSIRRIISGVVDWLQNTWMMTVAIVTATWQRLVNKATEIWNLVTAIIQAVIKAAVTWLTNTWNSITNYIIGKWNFLSAVIQAVLTAIFGFIQQKWNILVSITTALWNTISGIFSAAWNTYIAGPLGSLWNSIVGWFNGLSKQASGFGSNLIQQFINGITSMLGNVGNAASQVADTVKGFLGFHSPAKMGPGKDANQWGPNLVKMFANDIRTHSPKTQAAAEQMMGRLAATLKTYPAQIAQAHLAGNAIQEKSLRASETMLRDQMTVYKDIIAKAGFAFDPKNPNAPINFSPGSPTHRGKPVASSPAGWLNVPFKDVSSTGAVSGGGGATTGGMSSGGGGTTEVTNNYSFSVTVNAPARTKNESQDIANMVIEELSRQFRRNNNIFTSTSGGRS